MQVLQISAEDENNWTFENVILSGMIACLVVQFASCNSNKLLIFFSLCAPTFDWYKK